MKELFIIKLGGSVITDKTKPYTAKKRTIRRIARELCTLKKPFILIHGSGSFGHTSAKKYGGQKGYISTWGVAKVASDAVAINAIVMKILLEEKIPAVSLRPMSMFFASAGKLQKSLLSPLEELLKQQFIPVLYGDGILDEKWKTTIFSGEKIASLLTPFLQKKGWKVTIIQLTNTNGVENSIGKTIPLITSANWPKVKHNIFPTEDATGGMYHKIEVSLNVAKYNVKTFIINGNISGELSRVVSGKNAHRTLVTR